MEITPVNDSPTVRASQPESLPLVPFEASDNTGMLASEIAGLFYEDVDEEDNLGLAILYASTTTLGEWQIKGKEEAAWRPLSAPSTFPIPSDLKLARTHRGAVQVTKFLVFDPILTFFLSFFYPGDKVPGSQGGRGGELLGRGSGGEGG